MAVAHDIYRSAGLGHLAARSSAQPTSAICPSCWGRVMAKIGYTLVSTRSHKDDRIFTNKASGKNAERPELGQALAYLREGDVFVIIRLSRTMRWLKRLLTLADDMGERGIGLVVLKQHIDTTTPTGRLVFHILGAIDEFQRELIVEGTRAGVEAAGPAGAPGGRKPKLNDRGTTLAPRSVRRSSSPRVCR